MSGTQRAYTFRIEAEGIQQFVAGLGNLRGQSVEAQRAIDALIQSSPSLASALMRANDAVDRAANRTKELASALPTAAAAVQQTGARVASSAEQFGALEGRALRARGAVSDLSGALSVLGQSDLAGTFGRAAGTIGNVADLFGTLQRAVGAEGVGLVGRIGLLTTAMVGLPVLLQQVGLGINAAGDASLTGDAANRRYSDSLKTVNEYLGITSQNAIQAAQALRQTAMAAAESMVGTAAERRGTLLGQIQGLDPRISAAESDLSAAQLRQSSVAERFGNNGAFADEVRRRQAFLETLRQQRTALQEEFRQMDENVRVAQGLRERVDARPLIMPSGSAPAARGGSAGQSAPYYDPETGYTNNVGAALDRMRDARENAEEAAQTRIAAVQAREQQAREREAERSTDRIIDYAGSAFADLFKGGEINGKKFFDGLVNTGISAFAKLVAEAALRPIIQPIAMQFAGSGGGGLGGGGGGLGSLFGGGSGSGGGLLDGLFGGYSDGSGGFLSRIGNTNLFGGLSAEATAQATAALPAGAYGPVLTQAGAATAGGAVTLSGFAGASGLGFGAGTLVNSLLGGNQQNGMIGSAGGALAGAAIGSIIPGIGTVLGGLIGGAAGGGLGGLFGGGGGYSGGSVFLGVDGNGQLAVSGASGKRWNPGSSIDSVNGQIAGTNQGLAQRGLRIVGGDSTFAAIGFGGAGSSTTQQGIEQYVVSRLQSQNDNVNTALRSVSGQGGGIEAAFKAADFVAQVYEPLGRVVQQTTEFGDAMKMIADQFDPAIAMARQLGLSEADLTARRGEAVARLEAVRNAQATTFGQNLEARALRAGGYGLQADLVQFDQAGRDEVAAAREQLREWGISADWAAQQIVKLEWSLAQERLAIVQRYADEAARQAEEAARLAQQKADEAARQAQQKADEAARAAQQQADELARRQQAGGRLLEQLTVGGLGALSPEASYFSGLQLLNGARQSGNLEEFARVAGVVLPTARDFLGTSDRYASLVADVGSTVRSLGGDPNNLAAILDAQAGGNDRLAATFADYGAQQVEVMTSVRDEMRRLAGSIEAIITRRLAA